MLSEMIPVLLGFWTAMPLTEGRVADLAEMVSGQVAAARERMRVAEVDIDIARVGLMPEVTGSVSYERIGGFDDGSLSALGTELTIAIPRDRTRFEVGIRYALSHVLLGRLAEIGSRRASSAAERLQEAVARAEVRLEAKLRYHEYLSAVATASVAEVSLRQADAQYHRVRARFDEGAVTRADLAASKARAAERASGLVRARGRQRLARQRLETYLRRDLPPFRTPAGWAHPRLVEAGGLEDTVARALRSRSELAVFGARVEATEKAKQALWAEIMPSLDLSAAYLVAQPNPNLIPPAETFDDAWTVGVRLAWSFERAMLGESQRRRADARRAELEAERAQVERIIEEEVRGAWVDLEVSEAEFHAAQERVVAADVSFSARTAGFEAGRVTLDELLAAELDLAEARNSVVNAVTAHHNARARLARAVEAL